MPSFKFTLLASWLTRGASGLAILLGVGVGCTTSAASVQESELPDFAISSADHALLEEIERTGFQFFVEQSHPVTGLVRDRARADGSASQGKASIASSGFDLPTWAIAVERGWISRAEAVKRVRAKLRFIARKVPRQRGFFYHFLEMETGARAWTCELSSIDSAIFYAGAIVAREYFADPEITTLVNGLLADVDWNWFRNGGELISLGWHDETGFSRYRWIRYSEHVLMSFLALGVSPHPLDAGYWNRWLRHPLGQYGDFVYLQSPPLFVNQFPHAFMDLRGRRDAFANYFHNSRLATLAQRQFSIDLRSEFPAWGENLWGITASDSIRGYKAWGGPPRTLHYNALDGSVVPCATAGSLPFAPQETLAVLHHLRSVYGDRIWKRYGFVDAFNPHTGWVNPDVIGIDVGISVLQAENLRTGLVQRLFMQSPEAKLSLAKAGLLSVERSLTSAQRHRVLARAGAAWDLLRKQPASAGLQLTAWVAARQLGLVDESEAVTAVREQLDTNPAVDGQYAAGLIVVRQALPTLVTEATRRLDAMEWPKLPTVSKKLSNASRLTLFLQIARGARPASDWSALERATRTVGPVQVLDPMDVAGAVLPGLWLDERAILSGASAAQLAYATLVGAEVPPSPLLSVLELDQFPHEALRSDCESMDSASSDVAAAVVITTANLLGDDVIRRSFQQDAIVRAGRAAITEFSEAAFGPNSSVIAQRELSGIPPLEPARKAPAVAASLPRHEWSWQDVSGLAYKESNADVRAGDPPLSLRFAVTWDYAALYLHAEVMDTPEGYQYPAVRNRFVELFVDPAADGLVWTGPNDYQFTYRVGAGGAKELFHHAPNQATITATSEGYTIEASIPWASLGLAPRPGLEFGLSAAVTSEGTREWEPNLKLNWSHANLSPGVSRLGLIRLQ
ncbi:MAG: hypothetical protein JNN01_04185 [Opitutaceae bacterium]|nr:hypothetical protein [Opitutaceae bacterium]